MADKITGKIDFSPFNVVVLTTVFTGIFAGIAFCLLAIAIISIITHRVLLSSTDFIVSLALAGYIGLWLILVRHLWREQPSVVIDRRGVWYRAFFTHSSFVWEDVANIGLLETGIHHFEQAEVSTFKLKNGEKFVIWVDSYRNGAALRQVIEQAEKLLSNGKPIGQSLQFEPKFSDIVEKDFDTSDAKVFAGNHVFSFCGIIFYAMNSMAVYNALYTDEKEFTIFLMLHAISWFFGYDLYYFQMTENHFIARHHLFFWYKKIIPLGEIRECVFYQKSRQARAMRVILKDFRSFIFPAGSLGGTHWSELEKALEQSNISLRGSFFEI